MNELSSMINSLFEKPHILLVIFFLYWLSFYFKAVAWKSVLPKSVSLHTCLIGLFYNLLTNHLSPLKLGDFVRAHVITSKDEVPYGVSLNTVVWMRMLDLICLIALSFIGVFLLDLTFEIPVKTIFLLSILVVIGMILLYRLFPTRIYKLFFEMKKIMVQTSLVSFLLILMSWVLEATVIWGILLNTTYNLSFVNSIWVNSITIMGQIFQITPGGLATYETTMGLALRSVGIDMETSVHAALISHAFKFLFSFVVGIYAWLIYPLSFKNLFKKSTTQG